MTAILGISAFYHDSAAALVVDGEVVAAAQEERFSRQKHDAGFPAQAVDYCLREAERLLETYLAFAPAGLRSFAQARPVWIKEKLRLRPRLRQGLPGCRA